MNSPKKRKLESEPEEVESGDGTDEDIYVVERILAQMVDHGQTKYLVKWLDYRDDESTWEPAENFETEDTLEEWKKQLASGDTLDATEVAALEVRIGQRQQAKLDEEAEKERTHHQSGMRQYEEMESERSRLSPEHSDPSEKGIPKSQVESTAQDKTSGGVRAAKSSQVSGIASATPTASSKTQLVKFHAIASYKNARQSRPPGSIKTKITGEKFRNGRHMNNARKKARDEIAHVTNANVKPIAEWTEAISSKARLSLSSIEPQDVRDDSPLFFPDTTGAFSTWTAESDQNLEPSPTRSLFSPVEPTAVVSTAHSDAPEFRAAPKLSSSKLFQTSTCPRAVGTADILIQLGFGRHEVGDVLAIHFPSWLKTKIIRLKQKGDHVLPIHFQEDLVFNDSEFAEVTANWPPTTASIGAIKPFADTEAAVNNLAKHLAEHNLAAIWEYPDPNETIALVLYSPQAKSWFRHAQDPKFQGVSLIVEARNRAPQGAKAYPIQRSPNLIAMPSHQDWETTLAPQRAQPDRPKLTLGLSNRRLVDAPHIKARAKMSLSNPVETPTPAVATPSDDPRRRSESSTQVAAPSPEGKASSTNKENAKSSPSKNSGVKEKPQNKAALPDWSVSGDFRLLTKATKPLVYIAFAQYYPPKAVAALKEWAGKYTSSRFVFADIEGENEWDDFRGTKSSAILLFNEKSPTFGMLRDLWQVVARDNSLCYNVRLTEPTPSLPAKYEFSRVFPRGTVLLITEHTIVNYTKEAEFAVKWFKKHAKPGPWKLMLRPNIRSWLQQIAIDCEDKDKQSSLFTIFGWLYKLSSGRDVTVGGDSLKKLGFLGMNDESNEDFIVPLPSLSEYNDSPTAGSNSEEVSVRDLRLLDYFIYWSVMEASKTSQRFIVIGNMLAGKDHGAGNRKAAGHIRFWSPQSFMQTLQKAKSGEE